MFNTEIKALITLPTPLDICPNCGDGLILVLTEHADDQVIVHRTQLVNVIGDKAQQLLQTISSACPNKVEI